MSYTIKNDNTHGEILLINGKESICPFKPAVALPAQNSLGQMTMQLMTFPCCTACPHAIVERFGIQDAPTYTITCNGNTIEFNIDDIEEQKPVLKLL